MFLSPLFRLPKLLSVFILIVVFSYSSAIGQTDSPEGITVSGELRKWHKVTLSLEGPQASENGSPNPFMDYYLDVTFSKGSRSVTVPGYFAADGNAAYSGASSGNIWKVHFAPDEIGTWNYTVQFKSGNNIAISNTPISGAAVSPLDGLNGSILIAETNKTGEDNRGKGRLEYVGSRYLKFAESGEYFLKAGADSPENMLAYEDFDNTPNVGSRRKSWSSHIGDWNQGDPTWKGDKGKGIIGAINYLAEEEQNVFSFLTMNIQGDDRNVFPYISDNPADRTRMDCSKLDQWEILFEHADKLGMFLHFKTQETENDQLLDGGALGVERKIYYRELIARFSHHLALNWNLGEENTNTESERKAFAEYFSNHDPYQHLVVLHTFPGLQEAVYNSLLGDVSSYTGASIQTDWTNVHAEVKKWVSKSKNSGKPWVVANDEQGSANNGVKPDGVGNNHTDVRKNVLWGSLMAGGAGVEYYFGYQHANSDLSCQDFRSRDNMWDYNRYAMRFFKENQIPFWDMVSSDDLVAGNNNWCLAKAHDTYVVYLTQGGNTTLNLGNDGKTYEVKWFDPRQGGGLKNGNVTIITASTDASIGSPPYDPSNDWVALIRSTDNIPFSVSINSNKTGNISIGENVTINADVSDPNGSVASVKFFNGGTLLDIDVTPPYQYAINDIQAGTYNFSAQAVDGEGNSVSSNTVLVNVTDPSGCTATHEEVNGIVMIEAESISPVDGWVIENSLNEYSGSGYIKWDGSDQFNNPGQGIMSYSIQVNTPGRYRVNWKSRIAIGTNGTEHNDSWLRFPDASDFYGQRGSSKVYPKGTGKTPNPKGNSGDGWLKVFMNEVNKWAWAAYTSDHDAHEIFVEFDTPGIYTLEISGRSNGHAIDRVVLYSDSISGAEATSDQQPETPCTGGGTPPPANQLPSVTLGMTPNSPVQDAGVDVKLSASASDSDGSITSVSFYDGNKLLGVDNTFPYEWVLNSIQPNSYSFTAKATDNQGAVNTSNTVALTVPVPTNSNCSAMYQEENGLVIIEAEGVSVKEGWILSQALEGYTGSGYMQWNGVNQSSTPGTSPLTYTIEVSTPGTYKVNWRSRIAKGNSPTDSNDSWLRFPNASDFYGKKEGSIIYPKGSGKTPNPNGPGSEGWLKIYMNTINNWHWGAATSDGDPHQIYVEFDTPGVYTMEISGRSNGHAIDRVALYLASVNEADIFANAQAETLCQGGENPPANQAPTVSLGISPVGSVQSEGTNITLTANATDSDGSITSVSFYDGTELLGTDGNFPYELTLEGIQAGLYSFTAKVTDNDGATAVSEEVSLTVIASEEGGCTAMYQESNGMVIIEAEGVAVQEGWALSQSLDGYTGAGYIQWDVADQPNTPGVGKMTYTIQINTAGTYRFNWRSRISTSNDVTEQNDSWLRFPDATDFFAEKNGNILYPKGSGKTPLLFGPGVDGWMKVYMSTANEWHWGAFSNDEDFHRVYVSFDSPGVYTMEISGRSNGHAIDRIALYLEPFSGVNPLDTSIEEMICVEAPYLTLTPELMMVGASAVDTTISVIANNAWEITQKPTWVNVSSLTGLGSQNLSLSVSQNPNDTEREGWVVVGSIGLVDSLLITQEAAFNSIPCDVPTDLSIGVSDEDQIILRWSSTVSGATFRVKYREDGKNLWTYITNIQETSVEIKDLAPDTVFEWAVGLDCENNQTVWSTPTFSQTGGSALPPAQNLEADFQHPVVYLKWSDISDQEDHYIIERKLQGEDQFQVIDTVDENTTIFMDDGVEPNKIYNYRIITFHSSISSAYSDEVTVSTNFTTSLTEALQKENITFYPNPVDSELFIDIQSDFYLGNVKIRWVNSFGQLVQESKVIFTSLVGIHQVAVPWQINDGMYFLQFYKGNDLLVAKKIVVKRVN
ncbi:MAG: Ig-like domain-containing protein [Bacteroidota bacterium]